MRIHIRIPMTGEMLGHREYPAVFQPFGISGNLIGHVHRTLTERAGIDDRILRIDIDIRHRGEIHLYTQFTALPCHLPAVFIKQAVVPYAAQHHILRKDGRTPQAHGQPPLPVERNQQRNIRHALRLIRQHSLVLHQAAGEQQAADLVILNHLAQQLLVGFILIGGDCINKKLSYTFLQTQFIQHRVYPLPAPHVIQYRPYQQRFHGSRNGRCRRTPFRIGRETAATSHYHQNK